MPSQCCNGQICTQVKFINGIFFLSLRDGTLRKGKSRGSSDDETLPPLLTRGDMASNHGISKVVHASYSNGSLSGGKNTRKISLPTLTGHQTSRLVGRQKGGIAAVDTSASMSLLNSVISDRSHAENPDEGHQIPSPPGQPKFSGNAERGRRTHGRRKTFEVMGADQKSDSAHGLQIGRSPRGNDHCFHSFVYSVLL